MKDVNKLKNIREKYKRWYNIDFDETYHIHHIDFNRNNNNIENLLLLPRELHEKYHYYLQVLNHANWKSGKLELNTQINKLGLISFVNIDYLKEFVDIYNECLKWLAYKEQLDFWRFYYGK